MPRDGLFGGERSMKFGKLTRHLGLAVVAVFVVAACGSSPSNSSASCSESTAKTATSATGCGGMDALIAAAKAEGKLTVIALPPDWANYGEIITAFTAKYGIPITSLNPNGSSQDDVSKGVDFFKQLKQKGNYVPVVGTAATVKAGQTPVLFEWDYLSTSHGKDVSTWKIFVPTNAIIGGFYNQAINKDAPHPAAARLWEEFLYSDQGQNLWLKGGARPIRQAALTSAGTVATASAATRPQVPGTPQVPTGDQTSKASSFVVANWSQAVS